MAAPLTWLYEQPGGTSGLSTCLIWPLALPPDAATTAARHSLARALRCPAPHAHSAWAVGASSQAAAGGVSRSRFGVHVASESQEAVRRAPIASNARPLHALCLVLHEGLHPPGACVERLQLGRYACALAGASADASHQRRIASVIVTPFSSELSSSYRGNWCSSCVQQLVTNAPLPARDSTLSETSETRAAAKPAHRGVGI